jgi:hypothetical protein
MAKLPADLVFGPLFMKTPEELRGALVEVLRNGELDRDLANFIADMLEPKPDAPFRLRILRKRGNPKFEKLNYQLYLDIEQALEDFQPNNKRPSAEALLSFVGGRRYEELTGKTDPKTVRRYFKFIDQVRNATEE